VAEQPGDKIETSKDATKKRMDIKFKLLGKPLDKPLAIKHEIPIDFWRKKDDDDEPMIVEVHEANEGVPSRGKCIVCYKPIYETEKNDMFSCPNCNREAHYLCATIFITEYLICPVCSSKLELDKKSGKYFVVKR
jgi:DNA-directed RNA polymerase subunit RPC12/RpoP